MSDDIKSNAEFLAAMGCDCKYRVVLPDGVAVMVPKVVFDRVCQAARDLLKGI